MEIRADFSEPARVTPTPDMWVPAPSNGVERLMLDRIGQEVARATTLVRFAPNSSFPTHQHDLGEEYLVLDGVFSDENGDFPAGTYVRNPPGTAHAPKTREGCTIFVKLRQFDPADRTGVAINTVSEAYREEGEPGVAVLPLFEDLHETVTMERLSAGTEIVRHYPGGAEILVIDGDLTADDAIAPPWTWMRIPRGGFVTLNARSDVKIWQKTGHIAEAA